MRRSAKSTAKTHTSPQWSDCIQHGVSLVSPLPPSRLHLHSLIMGAFASRPAPITVKGVSTRLKTTPPGSAVGVRVCVSSDYRNSSRQKAICARAGGGHMRAACRDACSCACEAMAKKVDGWWKRRQVISECSAFCTSTCDQPPRVAKSEFEVTVR